MIFLKQVNMVMQKMKRIVCVAVAAVLAGAVAENVQLNPGTHRAAPEGFPGAVLVTADADGAPHFDCVGEAAPEGSVRG